MPIKMDFADELDLDEIQNSLDQILGGSSFDFGKYVSRLIQGDIPLDGKGLIELLWKGLCEAMESQKSYYMLFLMLGLAGAVLVNSSKLMQSRQVSDTAHYIVYLLFYGGMLGLFSQITAVVSDTLQAVFHFVKILLPTFFIAVGFSQGAAGSAGYYEFTLFGLSLVDLVLVKFVLPGINLYFLFCLANAISEKNMFQEMTKLMREFLSFLMKTLFGVIMAMQVVQGLIVPLTAELENKLILKSVSAIPGIGATLGTLTSTALCSARLVKNAVGVAGVIALVIICAMPLLKLLAWKYAYQLLAAFLQPIVNQGIMQCFHALTDSLHLFLLCVSVAGMTFVFSIALISGMT